MIKKILVSTALIGIMTTGSLSAASVETKASLKMQIKEFSSLKVELQGKIDAKEMTKKEANLIWKSKIEVLKKAKKEYFKKRLERIKKTITEIKKNSPEVAAKLEAKLSLIQKRREGVLDIRAKVEAGEVSKEEAKKLVSDVREAYKEEVGEINLFLKSHKSEIVSARKKIFKEERMEMEGSVVVNGEYGDDVEHGVGGGAASAVAAGVLGNSFGGIRGGSKGEAKHHSETETNNTNGGKIRAQVETKNKGNISAKTGLDSNVKAKIKVNGSGHNSTQINVHNNGATSISGSKQHKEIVVEKKINSNVKVESEKNSGKVDVHGSINNAMNFGF